MQRRQPDVDVVPQAELRLHLDVTVVLPDDRVHAGQAEAAAMLLVVK